LMDLFLLVQDQVDQFSFTEQFQFFAVKHLRILPKFVRFYQCGE
jgi:hypothetical protein